MNTPSIHLKSKVLGATLAAAFVMSACGSDPAPIAAAAAVVDSQDDTTEAPVAAEAPVSDSLVSVGSTSAGDVLVDSSGLSIYGFLDDADGLPTCDGACADAWPPIFVDSATLPADLDQNIFSVVERSDGTFQLKAGKWPLYLFVGDAAPGDINGQGSGDVWFLATPDGGLIRGADENAAAATSDTGDGYDEESGY